MSSTKKRKRPLYSETSKRKPTSDPHGAAARIRRDNVRTEAQRAASAFASNATSGHVPLIAHTFTDPTISRAIAEEEAEEELMSIDAPEPMSRLLLPNRWWDHAGAPEMPRPRQPMIIVTSEVAQVLNFGIDALVQSADRRIDELRFSQDRVNSYMNHYDRILGFLSNAHTRLAGSTAQTVLDAALDVDAAIVTLLEEGRP